MIKNTACVEGIGIAVAIADFVRYIISSMDPASKKIVIVEDNESLAEIYKTRLELLGYTCFIGYNGVTGLYFIQTEIPDLVLLDLMIPDIAGGQVLETMRRSEWGRNIKVLVISNLNESEAPANLRQLGIEDYVVKASMTDDTIDQLVNKILRPEVQPAPTEPQPAQQIDVQQPPEQNPGQ